jgi:methyl-accepting chemotaxis protein
MNEVLAGVRNMSAILGEIAVASSQQSAGVEEVKRAVTQIEQATQQNAALVEEGAAAALSFQDEAARLAQAVGAFKVDHMEARDQAVALVRRAIAHLNAFGLERARRDFESPDGGFMHDEFYVFGNNTAGVQLFNARSRERTGQSAIDKKDARGRDFVRAFIEIAKAQGKGWHDYHHVNPVTGHVELKSAYVELVGDVVVGCGIYNDEAPAASSAPAARAARPARLTRFAAPGPARLK